jgi:hypothetical protein
MKFILQSFKFMATKSQFYLDRNMLIAIIDNGDVRIVRMVAGERLKKCRVNDILIVTISLCLA